MGMVYLTMNTNADESGFTHLALSDVKMRKTIESEKSLPTKKADQ
jgi:hypothetical protein